MFEIEFEPEALEDLKVLRKTDQVQVLRSVEIQLRFQPLEETRSRKKLRVNPVAEWELRIGKLRVFYNVSELTRTVTIVAVGFKLGNLLFIRGEGKKL